MTTLSQPKPSLQTWWLALRPFSFTASVIPAVMGGVIALWARAQGFVEFEFSTVNFVLCVIGCVAIHIVTNLVNDYYDFKNGYDRADNFGAMNPLVQGGLSLDQVKQGIWVSTLLAVSIGVYFIVEAGENAGVLIGLVLFGLISAYIYTAPPLSLKYRGLGDLQVIFSFATLMVLGAFYVQTKQFSWLPVLYSIPIGLLVDDILHINNLRDLPSDAQAGITTLATRLGESRTKFFHYVLSFGAFVVVILLVAFAGLTVFSLLTLLALPATFRIAKEVKDLTQPHVDPMIVARVAQKHALFGALQIAGLIIGIFVKL